MANKKKTLSEDLQKTLPKTPYQPPTIIPLGDLVTSKGGPNCKGGSAPAKCASGGTGPPQCGGGAVGG
jgi:hypothetical protein